MCSGIIIIIGDDRSIENWLETSIATTISDDNITHPFLLALGLRGDLCCFDDSSSTAAAAAAAAAADACAAVARGAGGNKGVTLTGAASLTGVRGIAPLRLLEWKEAKCIWLTPT